MTTKLPELVAMNYDITSIEEFVPKKNFQLSNLKVESDDFKPTKNCNIKQQDDVDTGLKDKLDFQRQDNSDNASLKTTCSSKSNGS